MIPCLYTDNVSFTVPGNNTPILSSANLKIMPEEFIVLLGHNGSGKSTLIKLLSGEVNPTTGYVYMDQLLISSLDFQKRAKDIITLTQRPEERLFSNLTLKENIILWESRFQKKERLEAADIFSLTGREEKFANLQNQPVKTLSGGEKQIFLLALVLAHPPRILFLDEHTSSLDPKSSEDVMLMTAEAVAKHKITTIMVTHKLEDAINYGSHIVILKEGHIVSDKQKPHDLSIKTLKEMME